MSDQGIYANFQVVKRNKCTSIHLSLFHSTEKETGFPQSSNVSLAPNHTHFVWSHPKPTLPHPQLSAAEMLQYGTSVTAENLKEIFSLGV